MAMAGVVRPSWISSLNPFRISGTALPPNLLLMAKLVVVGLFLKDYHFSFPDVFAPFFGFLEWAPDVWYRRAFKVAFLIAAGGLMFNRAVRTNCILIGCLFLIATLSSKVYYRNAQVFVGLLFLLTGLQERGRPPVLVWWQLAVMYFGSGLNKLLEPDWRSGRYFDYFLTAIYGSTIYETIVPVFPAYTVAAAMCWWVITAELGAGMLFLWRRFHYVAIWLAASVHCGAAVLVVGDYGIFLAAVLASYLSIVRWPNHLELRCGSSRAVKALRQLCGGANVVVVADSNQRNFILNQDGRTYTGWQARFRLAFWSPVTWFIAMISLTAPTGIGRVITVRCWGTAGIVVLAATAIYWLVGYMGQRKSTSGLPQRAPEESSS